MPRPGCVGAFGEEEKRNIEGGRIVKKRGKGKEKEKQGEDDKAWKKEKYKE